MLLAASGLVCFISYLLPLAIPKQHWLRYYACYISYMAITLTAALIFFLLHLVFPFCYSFYIFGPTIVDFISMVLNINWEIRNKNILEKYKKAVIVVNHQSMLDLLALLTAFRPLIKYTGVCKKELLYVFPIGPLLWFYGSVFIDRKKNTHLAMAAMKDIFRKQDKNLVIFPEGTRNKIGNPLLPFKKGAFRIAIDFKIPIIPVVISPYYFIKAQQSFAGGKTVISVMEPINTDDLCEADVNSLANNTRELMQKELSKMKQQLSITKD